MKNRLWKLAGEISMGKFTFEHGQRTRARIMYMPMSMSVSIPMYISISMFMSMSVSVFMSMSEVKFISKFSSCSYSSSCVECTVYMKEIELLREGWNYIFNWGQEKLVSISARYIQTYRKITAGSYDFFRGWCKYNVYKELIYRMCNGLMH